MGSSWLIQNLLLLLGQHDDLLLALLLRRGTISNCGPSLRVQQGFALKNLGLALRSGLSHKFLETTSNTWLLMVSFVRMTDLA